MTENGVQSVITNKNYEKIIDKVHLKKISSKIVSDFIKRHIDMKHLTKNEVYIIKSELRKKMW